MTLRRGEEEVNKLIEEMVKRTKGKYITQGVSFNKTCPRQMNLLKNALMSSVSFSGLGKELLAVKFEQNEQPTALKLVGGTLGQGKVKNQPVLQPEAPKLKNVGNFL